jgi:hypothetical protein
MNKRVNFEDNVFILMMRLRVIRDTITLDADPELFLEKILDDISFSDHVLRILLGYLRENERLIAREEFLEHFTELEWQFSQVMGELLNHDGNIPIRELPTIQDKIIAFRNSSQERRLAAEKLSRSSNIRSEDPLVSSDELSELLKAL